MRSLKERNFGVRVQAAIRIALLAYLAASVSILARAQAGQLDTTFGTGGIFNSNFDGTNATVNTLASQSDGKIVVGGASAATTVLYRFTGGSDGRNPIGPLVFDRAGNLYGAAQYGGVGCGVIFELSPPVQRGAWTESVLYTFGCGADGGYPTAGVIFDQAGNLYGTTSGGGDCSFTCGTLFQLSPPAGVGGAWTYTVLHRFGGADRPDGGQPNGNLILDQAGNLFGTAVFGGMFVCSIDPGPCGVVFELLRPAKTGGSWEEKVLYNFGDVPDGAFPSAGVILDSNGNLYGNTATGGTGPCTDGEGLTVGCGTAFRLSPTSAGSWTETVLYNFGPSEDGPGSPFIFGKDGALYGTAAYDVFRLMPPPVTGTWRHQLLHTFTEGISGTIPSSGVTMDEDRNLYGTTASSGLFGFSAAFELSPPSTKGGQWRLVTLQTFGTGFDSNQPRGGLVRGKDGTFYGATSSNGGGNGFVFKIVL
jgi:uncharacterized repeat protein (TIGR03803 family)